MHSHINIQSIRLAQHQRQQDYADKLCVRRSLISEVEQGTCLLMPNDINKLCEVAQAPVTQLYPDWLLRDICRVYRPAHKEVEPGNIRYRQIGVRVRQDMSQHLTRDNLRKCGYKDITAWIYVCISRLQDELREVNNNTAVNGGAL